VSWRSVKTFQQINGDVFFVNRIFSLGSYVTRFAFADPASSREIIRTAEELRTNALAAHPPARPTSTGDSTSTDL